MTRSFDASHVDSFASGAWPLLSWVLDDRPARGLQSGLALGEFSCCQFLVDNSLHFVKNFSRLVLKGLATYVYNSQMIRPNLKHVPFVAVRRAVMRGSQLEATARSATMAQRIANALNAYRPGERGK